MKKLTPRKLHILQLTARGLKVSDVAKSLKVSKSAIEKHLIEIRRNFDAKNITHAVYKAVKAGIIVYACLDMVNTGEQRRNVRRSRLRQDYALISQRACSNLTI